MSESSFSKRVLPRTVDRRGKLTAYLRAWKAGSQAKAAIGSWISLYNYRRPHTAQGGLPPAVVYFNRIETERQA